MNIYRISLDSITIFEVCDPEFIKKLLTDGSKRAVVITSEIRDILYALDKGKIDLTRLEESIITDNMALVLRSDNFMTLPFHQKIMRLAEAGVTTYAVKNDEQHFYIEPPEDKIVLTLGHLGTGFFIWLGCLGFATIFFMLEFLWQKRLSGVYAKIRSRIIAKVEWYLVNLGR